MSTISPSPRPAHRRASRRLRHHDYARDATYLVTVCTHRRQRLFGVIADGVMVLSPAGQMVHDVLAGLGQHVPLVTVDAFVVMPDHVHAIFVIRQADCAAMSNDARPVGLAAVIGRFKTWTLHHYGMSVAAAGWPRYGGRLWHRNYHERIVWDLTSLPIVRRYIRQNPGKWRG